jgi:hypothetical protein
MSTPDWLDPTLIFGQPDSWGTLTALPVAVSTTSMIEHPFERTNSV